MAMLRRPDDDAERPLGLIRRTVARPLTLARRGRAGSGALVHAQVLETLRVLNASVTAFDHLNFTELSLHEALEHHFGRPVGYELIPDDRSAMVRRLVRREAIHAELVYEPAADAVSIKIAASLHEADRKEAHYHELAHLIAGHPVPYRVPGTPPEHREFWYPPRSLCRRTPPFDAGRCKTDPSLRKELIRWCEGDADTWVEHLRAISALGRQVYLREERVIGL